MAKAKGPLAGVRVLDLTRVLAGPFCAMMLGDMGAEVIKVEEPGKGDDTRSWPPFVGGESTYFMSVNRSKKSITLNLKAKEGQEIFRKLVKKCDVLLENFRPGTMDKLGFGYRALARLNPRLVYCSVSGFGESGPEAHRAGYDLVIQAESGVMDLTGFADGPPVKVGNSIGDLVAGMSAAHGVVLALLARTRSRRGQKVEISMLDVMAALLTYQAGIYFGTGARPARRGNAHPSIVPYEVFRASDAFVVLGVANNSLWNKCCTALGHPELATDPRFDAEAKRVQNRDTLVPLLNEILGTRPAADWVKQFEGAGIPAGLIKSVAEVCESEHLKARGMIVSLPHPRAKRVTVMGVPIRLHATPGAATIPPPVIGQHTETVLRSLLGLAKPPSSDSARKASSDALIVPATLAPLAPVTLEGRYLTLEPVAERHARDLFDVMQDEGVCRYLAWPPPQALDETLALIRQAEDLMARRESIVFAQIWKATGRAIGSTRLLDVRPNDRRGRDRLDVSRPRLLAHSGQYRVEVPLPALLLRDPRLRACRAQDRRPQRPLSRGDHAPPGRSARARSAGT